MTRIRARYEHGSFTPTEPVALEEGSIVNILVEIPDKTRDHPDPKRAYELIREIAAIPLSNPERGSIGRDHDKYLYTEDWKT